MEIREFLKIDSEQVKDLLVELQNYIIEIDKYNLNLLAVNYRNDYFKYLIKDCKKNSGKIFVALEEGRAVGMIAGFVEKYDKRDKLDYSCPKKGIVAELIVSKNSRGGGVGNQLLNTMENYFAAINCEYISLDVFAYNENATKFYLNHNYEPRMHTLFKKIK